LRPVLAHARTELALRHARQKTRLANQVRAGHPKPFNGRVAIVMRD
jgi:hypothetical protein